MLAAREEVPDVNIRLLLTDLARLTTAVDEATRHLALANEAQKRAQSAVKSAQSILSEAEAQRDGLRKVYEGLFYCGRSDCL